MRDQLKGDIITAAAYVGFPFAGASAGAAISKLDGATGTWHQWSTSEGTHNTMHSAVSQDVLAGEVFGPIALGAVAGLAFIRKIHNHLEESDL